MSYDLSSLTTEELHNLIADAKAEIIRKERPRRSKGLFANGSAGG